MSSDIEKENNQEHEVRPQDAPGAESDGENGACAASGGLNVNGQNGRSGRGGQVVDFWVYTVPKPTPIYIQGDYWHYAAGRGYQSQLNIAKLKSYYGASIMEPVEILTSTTPTPDAMYQVVKKVTRQ